MQRKWLHLLAPTLGIVIVGSCLAAFPLVSGKSNQSILLFGLTIVIAITTFIVRKRNFQEEVEYDDFEYSSKIPQRNYNLVAWVVIFVIGSLIGGLIYSGLIIPIFMIFLDWLPQGNLGIQSAISSTICGGVFFGFLLLIPAVIIIRFIKGKLTHHRNRHKSAEYKEYIAKLKQQKQ